MYYWNLGETIIYLLESASNIDWTYIWKHQCMQRHSLDCSENMTYADGITRNNINKQDWGFAACFSSIRYCGLVILLQHLEV